MKKIAMAISIAIFALNILFVATANAEIIMDTHMMIPLPEGFLEKSDPSALESLLRKAVEDAVKFKPSLFIPKMITVMDDKIDFDVIIGDEEAKKKFSSSEKNETPQSPENKEKEPGSPNQYQAPTGTKI